MNILKSPPLLNLAIVGARGGSNLGQSFFNAAIELGYRAAFFDTRDSYSSHRWLNSVFWRFVDRRPFYQARFQEDVLRSNDASSFDVLISTGLNPLSDSCILKLRQQGVRCLHFSTDDPWNSSQKSRWFLNSLSAYNHIFNPRMANMSQFHSIVNGHVSYLPFGFDHLAIAKTQGISQDKSSRRDALNSSLLFVGGADGQRSAFMGDLQKHGVPLILVGGYWDQFNDTKSIHLGHQSPQEVARLTQEACVNLIIPRHSNRDGHTMRSFEAAALGGCLLVEDSEDHRRIYGDDGDCVIFFKDVRECALKFNILKNDPALRRRLAQAVHQHVWNGSNSYSDRLQKMLAAV